MFEKYIRNFPPRYGPEWGSGGVFGLKYYKDTLYFTLAFEGESHFINENQELIYNFELIGPGPVSGGDTYNAVDAVDDSIYFGGWIHAPVIPREKVERYRSLVFTNKYSHIHEYNINERKVKLIWKESLRHENKWAGEVSDIIYNPINDNLLIARADGHERLGIFALDREGRNITQISNKPALKGSMYFESACFDISSFGKIDGFQCLDLTTHKVHIYSLPYDLRQISVDGDGSIEYPSGFAAQLYGRYFHFVKGGAFVGDPLDPGFEPMSFVRLFNFGKISLSPRRTNAIVIGGGLLVPFNSYVEAAINIPGDSNYNLASLLNYSIAPSVLLYITPPQVRIVGSFGSRITSLEKVGSNVLLGYSTTANLGGNDVSLIDSGTRGIMSINEDIILHNNPPTTFRVKGDIIGNTRFGGIPLVGYKDKSLIINSSKENTLHVTEYLLGPPPTVISQESFKIEKKKEIIDLGGYHGILSFRFENNDTKSKIQLFLQ